MPLAAWVAANEGLVLGIGLIVVAALFGSAQLQGRQRRAGAIRSVEDASYFARQDVRRACVSVILVVIGFAVVAGTHVDPRANAAGRRIFIGSWLLVAVLLIGLLGLALSDWFATRAYAHRQRRALLDERLAILADELKRQRRKRQERDEPGGIEDGTGRL